MELNARLKNIEKKKIKTDNIAQNKILNSNFIC